MEGAIAPETRYAQSGDISIAYQVTGEGPMNLVFVPGFVSNVELRWDIPAFSAIDERLRRFTRVLAFDKRGTGLSDASPHLPTLEERMDDVRAVMDAAGMERAVLLGVSEGGPMSLLFAATYPERVSALVLWNSFARASWASDNPEGVRSQVSERTLDAVRKTWGTGMSFAAIAFQDLADDGGALMTLGRYERNSATPSMAAAALRFGMECDVRDILPTVTAPTLVIHRVGDPLVRIGLARDVAAHIDGARLVELPGDFHVGGTPGVNADLFDEVEEFLTGVRPEHTAPVERVLKTVVFTDIVDSTKRASELGDRKWRELLDAHDEAVRRSLSKFGGNEVKTTGDGFLASFDGPARAIRSAREITEEARRLGIEVRAGVHTGEAEQRGDDLAGIAVHVGARVVSLAQPSEVLVTSTVRDLVLGAGIEFVDRGAQTLKGVPGQWDLLAVR